MLPPSESEKSTVDADLEVEADVDAEAEAEAEADADVALLRESLRDRRPLRLSWLGKLVVMRRGTPRELLRLRLLVRVLGRVLGPEWRPCSVSEESEVVRCEGERALAVSRWEEPRAVIVDNASRVPPNPAEPVLRPPPAAMAAALKTAAALRPSSTACSRSRVASRRPWIW